MLRQEQGLARVLDAYTPELTVAPGLDSSDARVLMVLDQFEETFHPSNCGAADVEALVQRVLDHFFNPHPRCHLVLTMRSEFLNHCAAYLELPDAINRSSCLVRRLGAQLESLLRRLAFKDVNSGTYSRQRISVDEAAQLLGPGQTRADLRALVSEGFLGSVDAESARQEQFVELLRNCQLWLNSDRSDDLLLETGELRRLREAQIDVLLADAQSQASATRLLVGQRDGPALAAAAVVQEMHWNAHWNAGADAQAQAQSLTRWPVIGFLTATGYTTCSLPMAASLPWFTLRPCPPAPSLKWPLRH